jgi:hypothetical protein
MRSHPTKKQLSQPDAQAFSDVKSRYFTWLIQRETKRLRQAHFIGKGKLPIRTTQA